MPLTQRQTVAAASVRPLLCPRPATIPPGDWEATRNGGAMVTMTEQFPPC